MSSSKPSFTSQSPKLSSFHGTLHEAFEAGDPNANNKVAERQLVDVVRQIYDCLAAGDVDGMVQHFAPDIVVHLYVPAEFEFLRHAKGPADARMLILHNFQSLEAQVPRILSVIAQGDTVMLTLNETGINRATGAPYSVQAAQRFTIRNDKVAAFSQIVANA